MSESETPVETYTEEAPQVEATQEETPQEAPPEATETVQSTQETTEAPVEETGGAPEETAPVDTTVPEEAVESKQEPAESKQEAGDVGHDTTHAVPDPTAIQPLGATTENAPAENNLDVMGFAESNLAIRFTARPEGFYFVQYFPQDAPAILMYQRMEKLLRVEKHNMRLYWEGRPLTDLDKISEVCVIPDDGMPLMIDVEFDVVPHHLRIMAPGEQAMRSVEVDVHYGEDIPSKHFFVTLIKGFERKPFLGGYKHKKTEHVFHHATTQCHVEREIKMNMSNKLSRTTQTQGVTRSSQTIRECATQMPRTDLLVDETYDRIVTAKPYFSAKKLLQLQVEKTVQLQAYVRGWRARKLAGKLRLERDEEELALIRENQHRQELHQGKRLKEIDRRTHPRSPQDFAVLYNELEAWRLQEVQRIKEANIPENEKKVAMQELLKKETKLLQTIDRLQIQASKENRTRRVNTVLNKMASAKSMGTQSAVNVETPFTIRARELRDLYNGLQLSGLSIDERLDILLHVKWTVKEFSCPLTREIVELVDREADLLNRGRKDKNLQSLRTRLSNLFLQFTETPEFNPEAIQYQRVPLEYTSRPLVRLDKKR